MIIDVQHALNAVLSNAVTLQHAGGAGRIFELFVMTSIARELQARGYDVWIQRSDGTRINPGDTDVRFIQRGGAPTGVAGATQGANNASSIGFQFRGRPAWEIWNGIQFAGRSSATHEIDLAIVPASVGQALRTQPSGGIPTGRPRIAIECKDVGTSGSVDEMRAFIARLYDITLLHAHHKYLHFPNAGAIHPGCPGGPSHQACVTYWQENRRTMNIIARRTGFATGAALLAGYHNVEAHAGIVVGSTNADDLIDAVATWVVERNY
jgi:hypothetical protein